MAERPTAAEIDALFAGMMKARQNTDTPRWAKRLLDAAAVNTRQLEALLGEHSVVVPPVDPDPPYVPPAGFPGPNNTGPTLPFIGPSPTITTHRTGQVISRLDIQGKVNVLHDEVIIQDCRIRSGGQAISINGARNLKVLDCELDGTGATTGESIIGEHNYTLRRCNIHHIGEGPRSNGNVDIEGCWMHDFSGFIAQGAHQDGIQVTSGDHHRIVGNNIDIALPDGSNAAIFAGTSPGSDILVQGNLLRGGSYTVAIHHYSGVRVLDNRFAVAHHLDTPRPSSGYHGALLIEGPPAEVRNNVWHDGPNAGEPI